MNLLPQFEKYIISEGKSTNTIKGYLLGIKDYLEWFETSFNLNFSVLLRQNILDYKRYLLNIKNNNFKTVNHKLSALGKFNDFLIDSGIQAEKVIYKSDKLKIQQEYASPTKINEIDVKQFLQKILESLNKRNYAIAVLLSYSGMRISEALNIKMNDLSLEAGECIIRNGKGNKQRLVILNSKITDAIKEYIKEKNDLPVYLFEGRNNSKMNRTTLNKIFRQYSDIITPHQLRHFFCTNALEKNMGIHEVAYQAGHSNIHTTLLYTNPDRKKLKIKMENL